MVFTVMFVHALFIEVKCMLFMDMFHIVDMTMYLIVNMFCSPNMEEIKTERLCTCCIISYI
jgi:hypothetical protein